MLPCQPKRQKNECVTWPSVSVSQRKHRRWRGREVNKRKDGAKREKTGQDKGRRLKKKKVELESIFGGSGSNQSIKWKVSPCEQVTIWLSDLSSRWLLFCFVSLSPPELRGHGRREEPLLPVRGPVRPKQPAGPSVQSHPLEEDGEFRIRYLTAGETQM